MGVCNRFLFNRFFIGLREIPIVQQFTDAYAGSARQRYLDSDQYRSFWILTNTVFGLTGLTGADAVPWNLQTELSILVGWKRSRKNEAR